MSDLLQVDECGSIWTVTLNRAEKRNALSPELVEELIGAVDQAHSSGVDVLVFRGEGKSFCAGFDFSDFNECSEGDLLWRFVRIEQLLQSIYRSPALTVCLAQGKNFGAGVDLLASCKVRVASPDATFRMPGLKFGLVLGTRRLGDLIGLEKARTIQQVAATLEANEALQAGLITHVTAPQAWPPLIQEQELVAKGLDPETRSRLYRVLSQADLRIDLAELVASVVRPGLKQRIANYRAGG